MLDKKRLKSGFESLPLGRLDGQVGEGSNLVDENSKVVKANAQFS